MNGEYSNTPLISVIMGCYNASDYIREAIDSILAQTISDFEFIIIDDCSTDETIDIIKSYDDSRIVLLQNERNRGLGYSLNLGIEKSSGKFIARMDADDISMPFRFERELDYLKSHPNTLLVGSYVKFLGFNTIYGELFVNKGKKPIDVKGIRSLTLIGAAFYHPTVMFNASLMHQKGYNYNPAYSKAQDYELWSRVVWDNEVCNIPESLLYYRRSQKQASLINRDEQIRYSSIIIRQIFTNVLKLKCNDRIVMLYMHFVEAGTISPKEIEELMEFLQLLLDAVHQRNSLFDERYFKCLIEKRLIDYCRRNLKVKERLPYYFSNSFIENKKFSSVVRLYHDY